MTCHALACPNPAIPGLQQCAQHWMMLPESVRAKRPWVERTYAGRILDPLPRRRPAEYGQMELFA